MNAPAPANVDAPVFRVSAVSAIWTGNEDVLLNDQSGHAYLLSAASPSPEPLEDTDANALGMFFEPTIDVSWHTLVDLRRLLFRDDSTRP